MPGELPASTSTDIPDLLRPTSLWDLFWTFSMLALQGLGGVMAITQCELVVTCSPPAEQGFW